MAAAVRSTSSVASGTRTNTTFTAPAGIQNGDVLVILLSVGNPSSTLATPPTGFAQMTGFPGTISKADPWTVNFHAFYKVASSESGNYTCTHSSASTEGLMYAISGADTSTPINPTPTQTEGAVGSGTGNVLVAPSITTPIDGSLVIWYGQTWDSAGPSTPPTGTTPTFTERRDPGAAGTVYVADGVLATAGATGNKSVTTPNGVNQPWIAGLISVAASAGTPAAAGPTFDRILRGMRN